MLRSGLDVRPDEKGSTAIENKPRKRWDTDGTRHGGLETLPAAEASGHEQNGRAGGADAGSEEWRLMPLLGLRGNGTFCLRYGFGE